MMVKSSWTFTKNTTSKVPKQKLWKIQWETDKITDVVSELLISVFDRSDKMSKVWNNLIT